jgi:hypothetical protein
MDPPLWWTGMHNSKLQLMVHGPQIADLEPALNYPGVRIASVSRVENRNYLFIDLEIGPERRRASWSWCSGAARRASATATTCWRATKARPSASASTAATRSIR